jgi:hypothetical protein
MIRQPIEISMKELIDSIKIISYSGKNQYMIKCRETDKEFVIWYDTGPGQFKVNELPITKQIELNKQTFVIFGLIQAEATKSLRYTNFQFTNSNSLDVKMVFDYFNKIWKMPKKFWSVDVCYWRKDFNKKKEIIEEFWKKALNIENVTAREGTKYRLSDKAEEFGVASLRLNNKTAAGIILNFLYRVVYPLVERNSVYAGWYLTGLFEGDGVLINKNLGNVGFSFNPYDTEFEHYGRLFKMLGINVDKRDVVEKYKRYMPFNWKEQIILLDATGGQLFLDSRNDIFISHFLNNQYVKSLIRLENLHGGINIDVKNYSKKFNCGLRSALDSLRRLENLGLLRCDRNGRKLNFSISYDGYGFLEFINKLKLIVNKDDTSTGNCSCRAQ